MDKRPTVAHCATPFLGPTMVWIHDQVRSLKRYRPVVLTQAVQHPDAFPFEPVHSAEDLPFLRRMVYRGIRKVRGFHVGYVRVLRQEGARILHAHFGQEGYWCLGARRGAGIPMITTFYGVDVSVLPRRAVWRRRFDRLFDEGECFLAEGPRMGEKLVEIGCRPERLRVHRLGVDLSKIPCRGDESGEADPQVVLMYASFREKKGHIYGLRAFGRICSDYPEVKMDVVGDGPLRSEIEAEIGRLGLGGRVTLRGILPHATCLQKLSRASVLLYPSVTAGDGDTEGGAPVAIIEAMAAGVPVVSSCHADIPEIVTDGECGVLAEERDVEGLAEGLTALLGSRSLRERMGRAGRVRAEVNHSLERQTKRLEEIYDRTVSG